MIAPLKKTDLRYMHLSIGTCKKIVHLFMHQSTKTFTCPLAYALLHWYLHQSTRSCTSSQLIHYPNCSCTGPAVQALVHQFMNSPPVHAQAHSYALNSSLCISPPLMHLYVCKMQQSTSAAFALLRWCMHLSSSSNTSQQHRH